MIEARRLEGCQVEGCPGPLNIVVVGSMGSMRLCQRHGELTEYLEATTDGKLHFDRARAVWDRAIPG